MTLGLPPGRGVVVASTVAQGTFMAALVASGYFAWVMRDTASVSLFTALCGAAATNATNALGYWVNSNANSARKTELLAASTPPPKE
jgi:hypothetical protein